jgi:hypothetical protein
MSQKSSSPAAAKTLLPQISELLDRELLKLKHIDLTHLSSMRVSDRIIPSASTSFSLAFHIVEKHPLPLVMPTLHLCRYCNGKLHGQCVSQGSAQVPKDPGSRYQGASLVLGEART